MSHPTGISPANGALFDWLVAWSVMRNSVAYEKFSMRFDASQGVAKSRYEREDVTVILIAMQRSEVPARRRRTNTSPKTLKKTFTAN